MPNLHILKQRIQNQVAASEENEAPVVVNKPPDSGLSSAAQQRLGRDLYHSCSSDDDDDHDRARSKIVSQIKHYRTDALNINSGSSSGASCSSSSSSNSSSSSSSSSSSGSTGSSNSGSNSGTSSNSSNVINNKNHGESHRYDYNEESLNAGTSDEPLELTVSRGKF